MRNEVLDVVTSELNAVGIMPCVEHGGKHLKVRWGTRTYVASKTASDHRARANARAEVRRMLKEDGLLNQAKSKPDIDSEQLFKRIDRLQKTVDALTELMLDLGAKLQSPAPMPAPVAAKEKPVVLRQSVPAKSISVHKQHERQLLELIPVNDWIPARRLYLATTVPNPYSVIARLKRQGLVERRGNTQTSEWRRR